MGQIAQLHARMSVLPHIPHTTGICQHAPCCESLPQAPCRPHPPCPSLLSIWGVPEVTAGGRQPPTSTHTPHLQCKRSAHCAPQNRAQFVWSYCHTVPPCTPRPPTPCIHTYKMPHLVAYRCHERHVVPIPTPLPFFAAFLGGARGSLLGGGVDATCVYPHTLLAVHVQSAVLTTNQRRALFGAAATQSLPPPPQGVSNQPTVSPCRESLPRAPCRPHPRPPCPALLPSWVVLGGHCWGVAWRPPELPMACRPSTSSPYLQAHTSTQRPTVTSLFATQVSANQALVSTHAYTLCRPTHHTVSRR
jgi:hypothetical protein